MKMEKILLSNESFKLLQDFASRSPIYDIDVSSDSIQQLFEYKLIDSSVVECQHLDGEYIFNYIPSKCEYFITELGKGYLADYQRNVESLESVKKIAQSSQKIASSAETQANAAKKIAKKADVKGWIALIFSGITLLFEFAVNHAEIMEYINQILQSIGSK